MDTPPPGGKCKCKIFLYLFEKSKKLKCYDLLSFNCYNENTSCNNTNPMQLMQRLCRVCAQDGVCDIDKLFDKKSVDNALTSDGETLLQVACFYQSERIVLLLVNEKGADINKSNVSGNTPLHACIVGLTLKEETYTDVDVQRVCRIIDTLAHAGKLDVNVRNNLGATALELACTMLTPPPSRVKNARLLLHKKLLKLGADPNIRTNVQFSPLNFAINKGNAELVRALLLHGADASALNEYGEQAMSVASRLGHTDVVSVLKRFGGNLDVNAKETALGTTALHMAVLSTKDSKKSVLRKLLAHGADVHVKDKYGLTPLLIAASRNDVATTKALIDAGACVGIAAECEDNDAGNMVRMALRRITCDACQKVVPQDGLGKKISLKHCSACKQVRYCNADCQLAHWRRVHKHECVTAKCRSGM